MPLNIIIAGGGTGGHVFPGLALAEALLARDAATQLLFVGTTRGLEQKLVPAAGHRLQTIDVGSLKGAKLGQRLSTMAGLPFAVQKAWRILSSFPPAVVVGLGGYASAPLIMAARLRGYPTLLLEQNSIPGITNRLLGRIASRVVISYPAAATFFPPGKSLCLGNPLRQKLVDTLIQPRPTREPRHVLVLGGSQGASGVNQLVTDALIALQREASVPRLVVHHQTGARDESQVRARYREADITAHVEAFIEEMSAAYQQADLVIGRSGATTLAEVAVAGLPAILIPYPFAADDHQASNATHFVEAGAALMARQEALDGDKLAALLRGLLQDGARLAAMAEAMRHCGRPHAGVDIAQLVFTLSREDEP